jgi:probable HAF family extracellular repeat protein
MKRITLTLFAGFFLATGFSQAAPTYTVTDIGTFGGSSSRAYGINDSGQVVGMAVGSGNLFSHAFLYSNGITTDLGTLGGTYSIAYGINNSGQIVGFSNDSSGRNRAFSYSGSNMTDLGAVGGLNESVALGINNNGQIVGTLSNGVHSFLYSGGSMTVLGIQGFVVSTAINDSSQIVGYTNDQAIRAFLYSGSITIDLGTLGGSESVAYGINNNGQVVGYAFTKGGQLHAFRYNSNIGMTDLGTLGGADSVAVGINDNNEVVGWASVDNNSTSTHAFVYSDNVMTDLNSLIDPQSGWTITDAADINIKGQIAATGTNGHGFRALLLTPNMTVPEPNACSLVLAGLGLLGFMKLRWKV